MNVEADQRVFGVIVNQIFHRIKQKSLHETVFPIVMVNLYQHVFAICPVELFISKSDSLKEKLILDLPNTITISTFNENYAST